MAQEILRQTNFNGGELSPQAVGRRDLKAYASSLALCENMIPMAEGPIRRRPGLAHIGMVRNTLAEVPISAAMLTAPNGGTVAGALGDGFETTTGMGTTADYVILEIDFGAPTEVAMFDLVDFVVKAGSGGGGGGGGGDLDPLPDPTPPQYPWDPRDPSNPSVVMP